jgi:undecaprenyl-diphosphatase
MRTTQVMAVTASRRGDVAGSGPATRLPSWPPPAIAALVAGIGYAVLVILILAIGLVLTQALIPGPVGAWDNGVNRWFLERRTPTWNTVTDLASIAAGTGTILTVAGVTAAILAIRRFWRELGFLAIALSVEITVFLTTVTVIARPRPTVPKLDGAPATSSFPSGHMAAAIALYAGLAVLISSRVTSPVVRSLVWVVAVTIAVGVGVSRVYRGLHHPIDVFASVLVGVGALLTAWIAIRAADAVARRREPNQDRPDRSPVPEPAMGRR